jgi:hypothetical protein
MPWLDNTPPQNITKLKRSGKKVKWETTNTTNEMDKAWQFVIYLNEKGQAFNSENNRQIYQLTKQKELKFSKINKKKKEYEVRISVLDRLNNESRISTPIRIKL